jgi:hypothetical protein
MQYDGYTILGITFGSLSGCFCLCSIILYCYRFNEIRGKGNKQKTLSSLDIRHMRHTVYGVVETSNVIVDYTNRMPLSQRNRDLQ